ncbi:tyrosine-type recombinase/integrase [Escherichia coli]|uniref:tyrosine-type recombinase/integrase n=3 Tax=Escherichia coli TaxID=562 RepID=UPI000929FF77|nr:integrase arm-type DNA-binding domain-containing protein [Escherichia coli]AQZ79537.1 site-specific recombinase, phage integrase [Escherichia coli]MBD3086239.1 tyrosine-type recombinase/integrase [Escherichia coli]MBF7941288.1 tyrosine-type recombinase/integrase [Escherichia coli]MBF7986076.1 tyrosine-type recombinase/integrase [Escherichia coli]MBI1611737.1 tyrosine-type recombinase/integrase [Escherichia coli]
MALTARQVETARPKEKDYKLSDERGLYLLVKTTGARYWRLKYRIAGKEKKLALGVYPDVSLAEARIKRDDARKIISEGGDPGEKKRKEKLTQKISATNTFHALATEWHQHKSLSWSESYARSVLEALDKDIFPYLGKRSVTDILPLEMLEILRRIEKRGSLEKLRKVRQYCNQIFRYAIATGRATVNPASELTSTLAAPKAAHFPHLRADELPVFLRKLAEYHGSPVTRMATNLLLLTGLRTIELRSAEWSEIDFDNALWTIPESRMKMRRKHVVPLSRQATDILLQLKTFSGQYRLVFPGRCDINKPMSEASINMVLKRIGYDGRATGHGFRHTMSTILHEQGFNSAWIEMQLAHVDKNSIRGTYNHALYLDGRREMMQWYSDYIDSLSIQES